MPSEDNNYQPTSRILCAQQEITDMIRLCFEDALLADQDTDTEAGN